MHRSASYFFEQDRRNLKHHCIIGNPILSKGVLSSYKNDRATLRFDPSYSFATIKVRMHRSKNLNQNSESTYAVHLISNVTIPSGSLVRINAKAIVGSSSSSSSSGVPSASVVCPFNDGTEVDFIPRSDENNNHQQLPIFSSTRSVVNNGLVVIEAHNPFEHPLFLSKGKYIGRSECATSGACKVIDPVSSIEPSSPFDDATSFIERDSIKPRVGFDTDREAHEAIDKIDCPSALSISQWELL
jgi:hypothetical protein